MFNRIHLLTAVCLSASASLTLLNPARADDPPQGVVVGAAANADLEAQLPPGVNAVALNADKTIEKEFKALVDDAVSPTGFDNLVAKLVDQDRVRIKESLGKATLSNIEGDKNKRLADLIADIEGSWKSKYNQNFSIDYTKVFTTAFIHVQTGEVTDAQQLVGKWPVNPNALSTSTAGKVTQSDADEAKKKYFGGDVNLEKGRNIAIAHFMAGSGLNGVNASMIHEAAGWKFDVPNTVNGQKLYNNLINNLSYVDQHKEQWPADVNDGYRQVARAVVAAIYDVPMRVDAGTVINK